MTAQGLRYDLPQALRIVWLVIGTISGIVVVAPFFLSPSFLFNLFPICAAKAAGSSCLLCGMTTAFVSIGQHDWQGASSANPGSIALFGALLLNFLAVATYTMMRVIRHANT